MRKRMKRKVDERETEGNRKQIRGMSDPIPLYTLYIHRAETIIMLKPPSALTANATESSAIIHITLMVIFFLSLLLKLVKCAEI